jgi:uncharacterized membrane protein
MNHHSQGDKTTSMALIAIVAALALLGVVVVMVAVTIPLQQQQAEAAGCENSVQSGKGSGLVAVNASKGRCFGH